MTIQIEPLFDLEALLTDISSGQPCGDDTRQDASPQSPYFNLKDLRSQARALERRVLADEESTQVAQWKQLAQEIPVVLSRRSKDLEFVAWYIEALCREHGFSGVAQGFDLARHAIERHWDQLHPYPDEEGMATRIAPLVGLNGHDGDGTLIQPMLSIPLFSSPTLGVFAAWHVDQAAEINRLNENKAKSRINKGAASPEELAQAVNETSLESLLATHAGIEMAQLSFAALSDAMDQVMGGEPQPTTNIRKALERCMAALMHHAGERIVKAKEKALAANLPPATHALDVSGEASPLENAGLDPVQIVIKNRHQALDQLRRLSEFFLQTEPHSPIAYAISQAVRWSELSLPELLQELIADKGAREGFCRVAGVPIPDSQG